jgi:hypothetical protein
VFAPEGRRETPCVPTGLSTLGVDVVRLLCPTDRCWEPPTPAESWLALGRLDGAVSIRYASPGTAGPRHRQGCSSPGMQASDAGVDWFARRVSPARIHRSSGQMRAPSPPRFAPTLPSALTQAPTSRVRRIECAACQRGRQWRNAPHRAPTSGSARRARGLQRVPRMGAAVAERCTRHHGGEVRPRSRVSHAPCRPQPPPRATGGVHPQRHHGRPVVAPGGVLLAGLVMGAMDGVRLPGVRFLRAGPGSAPPWQDHPVRRRGGEHVGRIPRGMGRGAVGSRPAAPHGGSERWISRPSSPLRGVPRLDVAEGQ